MNLQKVYYEGQNGNTFLIRDRLWIILVFFDCFCILGVVLRL